MPIEPYSLEQAEEDLATLRGQVGYLSELLSQFDSSLAPNTPTLGYSMFSSAGQQKYISDDGNSYNTGRLDLTLTSSPLINSVTFAAVPGLSCPLGVGTYHIRGQLIIVPNVQGGAVELRFHGDGVLAWSNARFAFDEELVQANATWGNSQEVTAIDGVYTGAAFGAALNDRFVRWDGTVVVSTAGTVTLQAATTIAADTYNIRQYGGYMEIQPVS